MSLAAATLLAALAGGVLGSFLNVVIWRLPRGESVVRPPSHCPGCGTPIRPWDNIPVVSWFLLRGRCRHCRAPIAARYPAVEALTALCLALVPLTLGVDGDVWLGFALVLVLIPCAFIDLDHRIIPNKITGPAAILGLALILSFDRDGLAEHLIGAAAAFGVLFVAALAYPGGMGMGDVKLAGVLGLYLGRDVGAAMAVALVTGTVVGLVVIARKGGEAGRRTAIPFGPFLALGGLVALYAGATVVTWYLQTFA